MLDNFDVEEKRNIYSKSSILIGAFFSPIMGMILYSINLYRLGVGKNILGTVVTVLVYTYIINQRSFGLPSIIKLIIVLVLNLLGGIILTSVFWKHHIGDLQYHSKFAWIPLMIFFGVGIIFLLIIFFNLRPV